MHIKIFDPVAIYKKSFATEAEYADIDFYIDDMCHHSDQIIEERMQSEKKIVFVKIKIQQKAARNTALCQRLSCS